jgi:hypothetical protein
MAIPLRETFDEFAGEYGDFNSVHPKLSRFADMHAMLLLEPYILALDGATGMVYTVNHCHVYLNIDLRKLAQQVNREYILELVRCGVFLDATSGQLCFVTREWEERHNIATTTNHP